MIWKLQAPVRSQFARLTSIYVKPTERTCEVCGHAVIPDLLVEWADGSDVIGDFIHAGARIVVRESAADRLRERFTGFEKAPVKMLDHPKLYSPERITKRTPKRIWLPYEGPPLCELRVSRHVELAPESTVVIERVCGACGAIVYKGFEGMETKNSRVHTPRAPGKGLFVKRSQLEGDDFFKPRDTGLSLCTEAVKEYIQEQGFSNIDLLEAGELLD
ncbi:MAG: hypothetical protein RIC55_34615 [Pirellulaceae bacterium]